VFERNKHEAGGCTTHVFKGVLRRTHKLTGTRKCGPQETRAVKLDACVVCREAFPIRGAFKEEARGKGKGNGRKFIGSLIKDHS